jgi:hypothetical protein
MFHLLSAVSTTKRRLRTPNADFSSIFEFVSKLFSRVHSCLGKFHKNAVHHAALRVSHMFKLLVAVMRAPEEPFYEYAPIGASITVGDTAERDPDTALCHSAIVSCIKRRIGSNAWEYCSTGQAFAKCSFYFEINHTIVLPIILNQVDSRLKFSMRKKVTTLLNQVSSDSLDPVVALEMFLDLLSQEIQVLLKYYIDCEQQREYCRLQEEIYSFVKCNKNDFFLLMTGKNIGNELPSYLLAWQKQLLQK